MAKQKWSWSKSGIAPVEAGEVVKFNVGRGTFKGVVDATTEGGVLFVKREGSPKLYKRTEATVRRVPARA